MQRIVVAAKAGADQPWLADATAELSQQTGAAVSVVSLDGVDVEALSTMPRSELREAAEKTVQGFVWSACAPPAWRPTATSARAP